MIHRDYTEYSLQDIAVRDDGRVLSHTLTLIVRVMTCYVYQYWCFMDSMYWLCLSAFYLKYLLRFMERVQSANFLTNDYIYRNSQARAWMMQE